MEPLSSIPLVSCHCSKCSANLFDVQNDWIRVNTTFLTLSHAPGQLRVDNINTIYIETSDQTGAAELAGCTIRRISCVNCERTIGAHCRDASKELLQPFVGAALLKASRIELRSLDSDLPVDMNFRRDDVTTKSNLSSTRHNIGSGQSMETASIISDRTNRDIGSSPRQASLRRSMVNGGDSNLSTVVAKLNVITSQLTANESRFEAQRIQIDEQSIQINEQQAQLDVLRGQSEQIVDLLEGLTREIANLRDDIQLQSQLKQEAVSTPNAANVTLQGTNNSNSNPLKRSRGRGRPRTRCAICRQKEPLDDDQICQTCRNTGRQIKHRKRTKYDAAESVFDQLRSVSSTGSINSDQDETEILGAGSDEDNSGSYYVQGSGPTRTDRTALRSLNNVASSLPEVMANEETVVVANGRPIVQSQPNHSPGLLREEAQETNLAGKADQPVSTTEPFAEDSAPQGTAYSDIADVVPINEITISPRGSHSRDTSVAQSIPIEEIHSDDDIEMQIDHDSLEEGEILSQRTQQRKAMLKANAQHPLTSISPVSGATMTTKTTVTTQSTPRSTKQSTFKPTTQPIIKQVTKPAAKPTAKPTGPLPQGRAPAAVMIPRSINRESDTNVTERPRKPKPNNEADGDDAHNKIVRRVMGNSWYGVKRGM